MPSFFPSGIDYPMHLFPAGDTVQLSEVVPEFTTSLKELRGIIAEHLTILHTFDGKPIAGGERLHAIVHGLCEAVNSTGDICPPRFGWWGGPNYCMYAYYHRFLVI